jgi:hypothetical protein
MPATQVLPDQLMNSVLGKLYDQLTMGDDAAIKSTNDFFAWCTPGIPYPEDQFDFLEEGFTGIRRPVKKDDQAAAADQPAAAPAPLSQEELGRRSAQLYMQAENLARLVDLIPSTSGVDSGKRRQTLFAWNADLPKISHVYEYVLTYSQVIKTELDERTEKKIKELSEKLVTTRKVKDIITDEETEITESSELVKKYTEKMTAYIDTVIEYNGYRISALTASTPEAVHFWNLNASKLRNKVKAALNDWIANGYKNEYDKIAAFLEQVQGRDLTLLKAKYKDDLDKALLTGAASGSDFYYSSLLPPAFARSNGWTEYAFTMNDYTSHYDSTKKSWGAAAGGFFGIRIGGGASGSSKEINSKVDWQNLSLKFELAQVPIVRPWLHSEFLTSKYWKFHEDASKLNIGDVLSDGKIPPAGILTNVPTALIFARNLNLSFGKGSTDYKYIEEHLKTGGYVGFGPFHFGGHYSQGTQQADYKSHVEGQSIKATGMQIIGVKCHLLPKSPNPAATLPAGASWV